MSKGNTPLRDIQTLDISELIERYGIELEEDNRVWDAVEGLMFPTLIDWAMYLEDQDILYGEVDSPYIYGKTPSSKTLDGWY
jgi:hypothetical protein